MRCGRSERRNEEGSAAAGFALVAPLAVAVFLAVVQVVYLLVDCAVVQSAAHTAARVAATLGSTPQLGQTAADSLLGQHGMTPARATYVWRNVVHSGVVFTEVHVSYPVSVNWLSTTVQVEGSAAVVDEDAL